MDNIVTYGDVKDITGFSLSSLNIKWYPISYSRFIFSDIYAINI